MTLDQQRAAAMARTALGHVTREYPYVLQHVVTGPNDLRLPRQLFPIFFGSFDWHSCVHGWWSLLTLRRLFPDMAEARTIAELADASFAADKAALEDAYFQRPTSRTFERPYGWAWLLALHLEATRHDDRPWAANLEPLARTIAGRFQGFLPLLTYPIRSGAHFNTAFALVLALDWAERFDTGLAELIRDRAGEWFAGDRDAPAWEPSGDDFLSPTLTEALLMKRVMQAEDFRAWFAGFLPRLAEQEPPTLFTPATVSDRSDGKIAHLDGLNLSRAWCWRSLGYRETADAHLDAALPHLSGDYMGEHWLQSFALLALLSDI